jgi:hypothetical protein
VAALCRPLVGPRRRPPPAGRILVPGGQTVHAPIRSAVCRCGGSAGIALAAAPAVTGKTGA